MALVVITSAAAAAPATAAAGAVLLILRRLWHHLQELPGAGAAPLSWRGHSIPHLGTHHASNYNTFSYL